MDEIEDGVKNGDFLGVDASVDGGVRVQMNASRV